MDENEISNLVINKSLVVHKALGPGLLESVYETVLAYELISEKLAIKRQVSMPLKYKGIHLNKSYIADIIVNDLVIIEIKSCKSNHELYKMQLLSYLKISQKKLGLLLNFGMELMRDGMARVVNNL